MLDRTAFAGAEETGVSFLHEVVDLARADHAVEVAAQSAFMRMHVFGKPMGRLGVARGHGGVTERQQLGGAGATSNGDE